jgi:EmrB/QacA subfamily drug resistance transporter
MIIFGLGLGLCGMAQSLFQLVIFRLIQAVGFAAHLAMSHAIAIESFPREERGKALGIMGAVSGAGMLISTVAGGFLIDAFGWRSIFYLRLPIVLVSVVMAWKMLNEPVPRARVKFDLAGATVLFLTMICFVISLNRGRVIGWSSPLIVSLGLAGVLLLILFIIIETRTAQPLVDLRLFRNRIFRAATSSNVLVDLPEKALEFLLPFYLIQGIGLSATVAGLLLIARSGMTLLLAPIAGRISDRIGTSLPCALGVVLLGAGMLLIGQLGLNPSLSAVVLGLILVGVGEVMFRTPNTSAIMGSVPSDRLGTASAMVSTLRYVGISFGVAIGAAVFSSSQLSHLARLSSQGLPSDISQRLSTVHGFQDSIPVLLGIVAIALFASVLRGRR